jgi:peroxiredoxin
MARPEDVDRERWVDERLHLLTPDAAWDPSVPHGLNRLRGGSNRRRPWGLWLAAATAAVVLLVPNPSLRAFAHRCGAFIARNLSLRPAVSDLTVTDESGRPVALSSLRGKVVLLSFWPAACQQCQAETAWFAEFEQAYRDRGLAVLRAPLERSHAAGVTSYPTTLILDRDGRIAVRHPGFCSQAEYRSDIQRVLAE